jgi:hypothetical protein
MLAATVITASSVVIAATGLLFTMRQANLLRRREYADRIRKSASETSAALDRWKTLCLRMYDDIQPLLTDVDMELVETGDLVIARDHLWRGLVEARAKATERITAEKIETAYVSLYGYDARIHPLFAAVTGSIRDIDADTYANLLKETQDDVLRMKPESNTFKSASLGNVLRQTCAELKSSLSHGLDVEIEPYSAWLLSIIEATDIEIANKRITFPEIDINITRPAGPRSNQRSARSDRRYVYVVRQPASPDVRRRGLGGDVVERGLEGDVEERSASPGVRRRGLGGDVVERGLGSYLEERGLEGDVEERELEGDVEERGLGGDVEERSASPGVRRRGLGGDEEDDSQP